MDKLIKDNMHFDKELDDALSYNKPFNFFVSGRGPGKTTKVEEYTNNRFKDGYFGVIIKRRIVEINDTYIKGLESGYRYTTGEDIKLIYTKGDLNTGIVNVYREDSKGDKKLFFTIFALSNPITRNKSVQFEEHKLKWLWFDEYKCAKGEKYLDNEYNLRFKELYSTLIRYVPPGKQLVSIFAGNNYSLTDPYVAGLKIDVSKIKVGELLVGKAYTFLDIKLKPELREQLLKSNPLYDFGEEDAYTKYALDGISQLDQRLKIVDKQPKNYKLLYVFAIEEQTIGIYMNQIYLLPNSDMFWVSLLENYNSERRDVYCFNYYDLVEGSVMLSSSDRQSFRYMCDCFRRRRIAFKDVNAAFLFEQIYDNL